MPNPIWTVSASLEVRKVSIYGINSKQNCKKKEKWTQMRMPNRTECRYFFLSRQEFTVGTKPHIPAEPSPGFPSILQNPLLLPLFSKGGPSAGKPRKSSQSPRRKGVVHSDQDWLGTRCLQAFASTQLTPGVGTLWVLFQTAQAGPCPLDASRALD